MSPNTKAKFGWIVASGGIPIAVLITWLWNGAALATQGQIDHKVLAEHSSSIRTQEIKMAVLEAKFESIDNRLDSIESKLDRALSNARFANR